jgi:hypothetical protein
VSRLEELGRVSNAAMARMGNADCRAAIIYLHPTPVGSAPSPMPLRHEP